jgi:excisionase family DNA binding protein
MTADMLGLLSVEHVATVLGVHVRTVRRYLREGRLKGTRIGKQYRIAAADLAQLTGAPAIASAAEQVRRTRHSEASTVVQIDAISRDDAMRVMNGLGGAIKGRDKVSDTPLRVDTVYDETRARLKVIVTGSLATTVGLLKLTELYTEQRF